MRAMTLCIVVTALLAALTGVKKGDCAIVDTKHNLSISGPGPIKSTTEGEICVFCHTPHKGQREIPYLWNRQLSVATYLPYQSSSLYATVGQPTGASKLCLSCHDGTIALGLLLSRGQEVPFAGGLRFIPPGASRLGTDLSDDHPVSFVYDANLASLNPELVSPSSLPPSIKLTKSGEMQCTACHDPHEDAYGKFLVASNQYSGLCVSCHKKDGWEASAHEASGAQWNGSGTNPWQHTSHATVSENGCENCHKPHAAGGHQRLLNYSFEEDNCLVCHNGNVATKNIENELIKPYRHGVQNYTGLHDPVEDVTSGAVSKHVECVDCHNPHYANANPSPGAPQVSGAVSGVPGIDLGGNPAVPSLNSYEICFKCHADYSNVISAYPLTRQIPQLNTRLEFLQENPSYHPVLAQGVHANDPGEVPSLLLPLTTASIIFCTDCHANDSAAGPRGPHGSENKYLLAKNLTTADNTTESPEAYALCYTCHSREGVLGDQSFRGHSSHIVTYQAPCSACHDPHGISATQGNPANNSRLINFDAVIVSPDSMGRLYFEDQGRFKGQCYLTCHGSEHTPKSY